MALAEGGAGVKLVVLDRDGVINEDSDAYIKSPEEWRPLPGSLEAMARLYHAGYRLAVVTNQSGIARGFYDHAVLNRMHHKLHAGLAEWGAKVELICYCPHGPGEGCQCRKPLPGMMRRVSEALGVELRGVPVIGDSLRDLEAAWAVQAVPRLVRTGKGEATLARHGELLAERQVPVHADLAAAVDALLNP